MVHELKCWPEYYSKIVSGEKTFEVRRDDRGFKVGDALLLMEWSPETGYSGNQLLFEVTYILPGGNWGIFEKHCVMAIRRAPKQRNAVPEKHSVE